LKKGGKKQMAFWNFINKAATETEPESVELRIEGDIISDDDAWFYEWLGIKATAPNAFKEALKAFANKPITVWIDSYGGDVFAAAGIYNALMEHKGPVTVKVDGKAMSAASVIAMAGGEILMSPMAIMMIHNPLTRAEGDMHDLRHTAEILDQVKEAIINAYQLKTNKSRAKISEMMNAETFMNAKAAIRDGFADGMLYAGSEEPVKNSHPALMFNRLAIQNNAAGSMKRLLEIKDEQKPPDPPPDNTAILKAKLALAIES
jgi:ATP-dependent Clp protease protease subunit